MSRRMLLSTRVGIGFFFLFLTFILSGCINDPELTRLRLQNADITVDVHENRADLYSSFRAVDVKVEKGNDGFVSYVVKGNGILEFYIDYNNVKLKIQDKSLTIFAFGKSVEIKNAQLGYREIAIGKTGFILLGCLLPYSELEELDKIRASAYKTSRQTAASNGLITD